ncbi:MAG: YidC/Oxa1 family membrane protein insertase [Patescibacteria group bacterium]
MSPFFTILYQPMFNLLVWLYDVLPGNDIGFAIIVLTIILKFLLAPLSHKTLVSQRAMQQLQPKIKELKAKYTDKQEQAKAMMELYKQEKVNPLASCLPLIVQLPILIVLYKVLMDGLGTANFDVLYNFVQNPGHIDGMFLNTFNLTTPSILLAVLAGAVQFVQAKMLPRQKPPKPVEGSTGSKDEEMMVAMNRSMTYFMPVLTVLIGASLPGGLALYWLMSNLFSIGQQMIVFKGYGRVKAQPNGS